MVTLEKERSVEKIIARLEDKKQRGVVRAAGTWGSFAPLLISHIAKTLKTPILYIRPHIDDADRACDDLQTFGAENLRVFPAWEGEEDILDATDEIRSERLAVLTEVAGGANASNLIICASVQSLAQPVPDSTSLMADAMKLEMDSDMSPKTVVEWLVENSFERVDRVDMPGQFAHRGGIIDIFAPLCFHKQQFGPQQNRPVRIEFFGDMVESIRLIDLDTNLSLHPLPGIGIIPTAQKTDTDEQVLFTDLLADDTLIVLEEPGDIEETARTYAERLDTDKQVFRWADIFNSLKRFSQVHVSRFITETPDVISFSIHSVQQYQHKATSAWAGHKEALGQLIDKAKQDKMVYLYCEAQAQIERVTEIIEQISDKVPSRFHLVKGFVHRGFSIESLKTIVISHHELFGQWSLRRKFRKTVSTAPIDTLSDLQAGDYVVHASYGIGKYLGIKSIEEDGGKNEYLSIEYADGVTIQVSVSNIGLVQKFIGTSPKRPNLSKIGSKKWQKQKLKVAEAVRDMAHELLEVQAKRQAMGGFAFGKDTNWQAEFEESFPYRETPDQITAIGQIKADMGEPVVMDRLLCGDVGYGKTELAMRAAFKAIASGKQVAMLVPTTVLCVQHGRTFTERFADFPVTIEIINRFRSVKQIRDIIVRTREGKVDILIGTHRLLSGDVAFKDLGLLVIDEEQRFGVEHKEKLKKLRVDVDILTMTATPIPRTLHMSLLGLRDISSLQTPPMDRRSIVTKVAAYNRDMIKRAIYRELNRQGQVFFLHNRVKTIDRKAYELQQLVPEAKFAIAHGRMSKRELEKAMIDFVTGDIDVLVCTTIIESGLDIPNANTIFIDNADRFGLAELHQLRGRVGRYRHRAFAYMLLPSNRSITPVAAKRLKAIEEYSHLGAGFRIALRGLEIRGAGNILGSEQSGHIQLVGYQMYCELLAEAVRRLKGEKVEKIPTANIDLKTNAFIPKNYIPSDRQRMDVYRKIAVAKNDSDVEQLTKELNDIYGRMPEQLEVLLEIAQLRIAASKKDIKSIAIADRNLVFTFTSPDAATKNRSIFDKTRHKSTPADARTTYLHLPKNYFEPTTLISLLRKILT